MFQPQAGNPPDLVSINNCYVDMLLILTLPFRTDTRCPPGGGLPTHGTSLSPLLTVYSSHRIIFPPGRHLSPSYHTEVLHSLNQNPLPTHLPCPCHTFPIPNDKPFLPPISLLTLHSAASETPFDNTTAHDASPLPRSLSTYRNLTPPTPPLPPAACQCTCPVSAFLYI